MIDSTKILGKNSKLQIFFILLFFGLLVYSNAIFHPFVHDDVVFIEKNPLISNLDIKEIFFSPAPFSGKSDIANSYYRPLLDILYRIQYKIFGKDPYKYHLFNIILHIINAYLFFLVLSRLIDEKIYALFGSLLFLIHPVQSEAVACIVGVSNLLYFFLCFSSFNLYLLAKKEVNSLTRVVCYSFSLIIFAIALLAKEQSVVLPVIIILYEFCDRVYRGENKKSDVGLRKTAVKVAGFFFILLCYFCLRKAAVGSSLTESFLINRELGLRILSIPRTILLYVGLIFIPVGLHYYRNIDILQPFLMPTLFLSALIVICLLIINSLRTNEQKFLAVFGIGCFLVALIPVLNIMPIVNEYSLVLAADHFLYLPVVGMIMFVIVVVRELMSKYYNYKKIFIVGLSFILVLFCAVTLRLNTFWASEVAIFERTVKYERNFGRGHQLLAKAYYFNGNVDLAISEYHKALDIMLGYVSKVQNAKAKRVYFSFVKEIYFDLGFCYQNISDFQAALNYFKKASSLDTDDGAIHNNIGIVYVNLNDFNKAVEHFEIALDINGSDLMAMKNLALGYMKLGRVKEAEKLFMSIQQINGK
ncbi:MAG: tetratricopeptide repeat protein [Candidatus Omnitrophica bacterium]|nr:tetratricopeptide repeat protein [Candidatus Omnitrophota bacterium]